MKVYSWDKAKGKTILAGEIQEIRQFIPEKCFIKEAKASHFVRIKQAYGISCDVLDQLVNEHVTLVIIKTPAWEYHSELGDWMSPHLVEDMGNGPQAFLPVQFMKQVAAK